ncbi:MAG: NADH-quinone oxidoreductase subunit NuoN, partial [Proteobacteria bacterium]|nr:NADH-quinone oxidoreductase subunit NuoN [Pseudomonadota bacterium]
VMNGFFITDPFAVMSKFIIIGASMLTLVLSGDWLREEGGRPFEFVILLLLSTLGMMCMVSANDFLAFYMALELSSLCLYVLASFLRDHTRSSEAGLKYFVLGALASGMMLFGMSLIYGFAGSTNFDALAHLFAQPETPLSKGVVVGLVMVMIGLCFKVSAAPFHMWTPDVYEGAPTPVTAFFATAPKVAAMSLFTRLLLQPFGELVMQWQQVVIFAAVLSLIVGALAAIMQTNIKRLLAYSSIGHAGFMLIALASGNAAGVQAMLIYLAVYVCMSAGIFGCVLQMRREGVYVENIKDLSGLSQTNPLMAILISLFMFAMAGIPPMAGFFSKMYVLLAATQAGLTWLAVLGVLASVVSCYYYIRVVKVMYFDEPAQPFDTTPTWFVHAGVGISTLATLGFFLLPTPLVIAAKVAAEALLH